LIQYGQVSESWIGLSVQEPDPNLARYLNLKGKAGVLVRSVEPDSPAHKAGIKEGDVIVSIGNQAIAYSEDYYALMKGIGPGETLTVNLLREGSPLKVTFAAGTFPVHRAAEVAYARLGVKVADIQNKSGGKRSAEGVVITQVRPRSYLEEIGVKPGDVIRRIDEMPVSDTRDFEKAIVRYRNKNSVVILLFRGDQGYYVTVRL
jgi:S1-C subfamily serine protease